MNSVKISRIVCDKLKQLQPDAPNLLWIHPAAPVYPPEFLTVIITLRMLAEHKEDAHARELGFESAADLLKRLQRLNAWVWQSDNRHTLVTNPLARTALPNALVTAIERMSALPE